MDVGNKLRLVSDCNYKFISRTVSLLTLVTIFFMGSNSYAQEDNRKKALQSGLWYQIAVPSFGSEQSIRAIAPDELRSDSYALDWVVFDWDPVENAYREMPLDEPLVTGKGYWIIQTVEDTVVLEVSGEANDPNTDQSNDCPSPAGCVTQTYQIGAGSQSWNMFGSPYSSNVPLADFRITFGQMGDDCSITPCTLDEAGAAGVVHNELIYFDPDSQSYKTLGQNDVLQPWQGFWTVALESADQMQPSLLMPAPVIEPVGPEPEAGSWNKLKIYNTEMCLGFDGGIPTAGSQLVQHNCDSPLAIDGRFVRLADDGYGQVQLGDLCLAVQQDIDDLRASVIVDNCGLSERFQWAPADWRWNQTMLTLRSRHNGLCISSDQSSTTGGYIQDLCNPMEDRTQLLSDSFAAGLMAKDKSMTPVDATFHGTLDFGSFHEGVYPMDSWTFEDIAFYAPPGDVTNEMASEWMAWYSHMDGLHRRVWNQDNFDSVYRNNDQNHGAKKVTAVIDEGLCSCGNKQQAEVLGFKDWMVEDPQNWMYHWVMFYEMNRGGPTPNFYAHATWPNTHQGGLILPHMMAALAFYEIGGPVGLERDVPGDILRALTAWEYEETQLADAEIPADIQMAILLKILQENGTDVFIDTLHAMAEKPESVTATQAVCDFRDSVNESTGGIYNGNMINDWRFPTTC